MFEIRLVQAWDVRQFLKLGYPERGKREQLRDVLQTSVEQLLQRRCQVPWRNLHLPPTQGAHHRTVHQSSSFRRSISRANTRPFNEHLDEVQMQGHGSQVSSAPLLCACGRLRSVALKGRKQLSDRGCSRPSELTENQASSHSS